jgi:formamidopyrimidine-DNA glycosylase
VPELPEVETIVRDLRPLLVGRRIQTLSRLTALPLRKPWNPQWERLIPGQRIGAVQRRGKWIVLPLEGEQALVVHLGMTGQLRVAPPEADPFAPHTHLSLDLDDGSRLLYRDIRRFGSVCYFATEGEREQSFQETDLGPEPWELPASSWRESLGGTIRCLKAILLDQTVVAGVGNIYADEALFHAKLHPGRRGCDLTPKEMDRLRRAIVTVLERAIEQRGSTIRNYVGGSGLQGGYQNEFRVYGQTGEPCPVCRQPIQRMRLAGRSTHYCPKCQPEKEPRMNTDEHG